MARIGGILAVLACCFSLGGCAGSTIRVSTPATNSPVAITTSSLPGATVSQFYDSVLTAQGGTPPYQWSVSAGALPPGLSLAPSTGELTGIPSHSGSSSFTVGVKDSSGQSAIAGLNLEISDPPLQLSTASLPGATVDEPYSFQLEAAGGIAPYVWTVAAGALPTGVGLASSGDLSGTPITAGSFPLTLQVTDSSLQTASKMLTLSIANLTGTPCTFYVSPIGSDLNSGSLSAPWQTAQRAFNSVQPGQVVCFRGGSYPAAGTSGYSQTLNVSGTSSEPITITNYPGEVAVLHGSTRINGSFITFLGTPEPAPGLIFEGPTGPGSNIDLIDVMNTHDVTLDHIEVRDGDYHAGLYQYGGFNIRLVGSYIHDNGIPGVNLDHGVYWDETTGGGNLIANCVIELNAAQGIALYSSSSVSQPTQVTVEENTIVNNGHYGIDLWGDGNTVVNNILSGNGAAFNSQQMSVEHGINQVIDSNIVWSTNPAEQGIYDATGQVTANSILLDPLFIDPSSHNYHILRGSPAIGAGNPVYMQPTDKDGMSRNSPDLGAYEYVP